MEILAQVRADFSTQIFNIFNLGKVQFEDQS